MPRDINTKLLNELYVVRAGLSVASKEKELADKSISDIRDMENQLKDMQNKIEEKKSKLARQTARLEDGLYKVDQLQARRDKIKKRNYFLVFIKSFFLSFTEINWAAFFLGLLFLILTLTGLALMLSPLAYFATLIIQAIAGDHSLFLAIFYFLANLFGNQDAAGIVFWVATVLVGIFSPGIFLGGFKLFLDCFDKLKDYMEEHFSTISYGLWTYSKEFSKEKGRRDDKDYNLPKQIAETTAANKALYDNIQVIKRNLEKLINAYPEYERQCNAYIMKFNQERKMHLTIGVNYIKALVNMDILDQRDFQATDYLIYTVESGRAQTLERALELLDRQLQNDKLVESVQSVAARMEKCIAQATKQITQTLSTNNQMALKTMTEGFSALGQGMVAVGNLLKYNVDAVAESTNAILADNADTRQYIQSVASSQHITNALLERRNESSMQLMRDIKGINEDLNTVTRGINNMHKAKFGTNM